MKQILKKLLPESLLQSLRRLKSFLRDVMSSCGPRMRMRMFCNFRLFYNRGNSIVDRLKYEPIFEEPLCKAIANDLNRNSNSVFLDIGTNIGLVTLYIASHAPEAKIFAFEPGPIQGECLETTKKANSLDRLTISKVALSESDGRQTFYIHPKRDMSKDGLVDTGRGEKTQSIEVTTKKLNTWWHEAGKPAVNVIKIDTEGAELFVLRGAREVLQTLKPIIYFELEESNLKAYPYEAVDIFEFLTSLNYKLMTLQGEVVTRMNLQDLMKSNDTFRAE